MSKHLAAIIAVVILSILLGFYLFERQKTSVDKTTTQESIKVWLSSSTYKQGEIIQFNISNQTNRNIYYYRYIYDDGCGGSLVSVISLDQPGLQLDEPFVCTVVIPITTLAPNESLMSQVSEKVASKMVPGRYKLRFTYSWERGNRSGLGETISTDSELFTIVN